MHGDILDTWKKNRLRSVVGRTYPPRATDARDARFETCCSTLAGLPVEGVFRAGGNKDPHMHPSGQAGKFNRRTDSRLYLVRNDLTPVIHFVKAINL